MLFTISLVLFKMLRASRKGEEKSQSAFNMNGATAFGIFFCDTGFPNNRETRSLEIAEGIARIAGGAITLSSAFETRFQTPVDAGFAVAGPESGTIYFNCGAVVRIHSCRRR
jgi:hypothetical protein